MGREEIVEDEKMLTWRFMLRKYLDTEHRERRDSEEYKNLIFGAVENYFLDHLENRGYNIYIVRPDRSEANAIARRIENSEAIHNSAYAKEMFGWIKGFFDFVGRYLRWESNPLENVMPPRSDVIFKRCHKVG